jgi:hypothetical protein
MKRGGKYQWIKGQVKELEPGTAYLARREVEFLCLPGSFAQAVYRTAREKGWRATVAIGDTWVAFTFYRPDSYLRPNMPAYPIVKKMRRET